MQFTSLSSRRLAVFLYHPTMEIGGKALVKAHYGQMIDEIAPHFEKVDLIAPFLKEEKIAQTLFDRGLTNTYSIRAKNVEIVRGISLNWFYPLRVFQHLRYLIEAIDVLFFAPSIGSAIVFPICQLIGRPTYCFLGGEIEPFYRKRLGRGWGADIIAWLERRMIWRTKGLLVTSAQNAKRFHRHPQMALVPPLLNFAPEFSEAMLRGQKLPNRTFQKGNPLKLLYVGRIEARKRIHILLETVRRLQDAGVPCVLQIAGSTTVASEEYQQALLNQVGELAIEDQVIFLGYIRDRNELERIYRESDFFLMISEHERFPKSVYEAMAYGTVPVLARIESFDGILQEGQNCLFVTGNHAGEIADRLQESNEATLNAIREKNFALVHETLSTRPSQRLLKMIENQSGK